ncbi:hypothetical protein RhiirA4_545126 [Rhizophagus irregularis]|uniref:CCHC-type domain-containing protein n=1 Tax=Rhizophagus irregularis TaxID=588596 RepID=A0A2I1GRD2_9GLOM|nr:hypothetical protein RhiirA4_545126 [Rhizophagus irregularis]
MENMEEESSEDTQTSEFTHDDCSNIGDEMVLSNENNHTLLYSGRKFESWEACENFINKRSGKGRPLGTKRFKSSTEAPKPKSRNQRNCRKCGKVGQNCKEQEI